MLRSFLVSLLPVCALSACASGSSEPEAVVTPTPSSTPTAEPTPTVLAFGAAETVAWSPTIALSGELSIAVEKVRAGDFADFEGLDGSGITEDNQPFYVDVVIANEGEADFGGLDVPLYLRDSNGTLSPPWRFATPFKPCDSGPFPASFGTGDELDACLVFFGSPDGTFESVTFQPSLEAAPITRTGEVAVHADKPAKKQGRGKKKRR
ncbi:hypothetical protein [Nocardioides sp. B-3]|uniref:hypothetical protein n=1 Tax=Nocardioides sp. B-3 TaxID=2895565 RepID=UPI0021533A80|nr:hypothetical protein [Nocardioides sp. B-3]UUZ58547.1 hypothetical protein LP418_20660 [Nocardioides sp. B-3]